MGVGLALEEMLASLSASTALPEIALGLERVEQVLERLGQPHLRLPMVVHIAGTNGKGSTLAGMRAMLEANGKQVHAYTSPHLVDFRERIVVAGELVDSVRLLDALQRVTMAAADIPLTFFEATTLAAFLIFSEVQADVTLVEVGLGGRLDATNVVAPVVCVLTPISEDHKEFLGDSLAAIAGEKAGIIKPGVAAVVAPQEAEAMRVICQQARCCGAEGWVYGEDWSVAQQVVQVRGMEYVLASPALVGEHQYVNAACAFVACLALGEHMALDMHQAAAAVAMVRWPARLQPIVRGPLVDSMPEEASLWLDGGHNPAAGGVVAVWAGNDTGCAVGMLRRKDAAGFFRPLAEKGLPIATLDMQGDGYSARELEAIARSVGVREVRACGGLAEALAWLLERGARRLLICGSLYLAGKVLENHS